MTRQVLLVSRDRPGAYQSIGEALRAASDGALITVAGGTYEEALVITRLVTVTAESGAGEVLVRTRSGSAVVVDAEAVQLSGLTISGGDDDTAAVEIRRGEAALDIALASSGSFFSSPRWKRVFSRMPILPGSIVVSARSASGPWQSSIKRTDRPASR